MVRNKNAIRDFIDDVAEEKLKNFSSGEYTIVTDKARGFRLDHQGKNQDGSGKDRLYIQSLGRGTSKASQCPPDTVLAQVHVTDPADPQKVREALLLSSRTFAKIVDVGPAATAEVVEVEVEAEAEAEAEVEVEVEVASELKTAEVDVVSTSIPHKSINK